jgi:hypothetical protein
MSTKRTTDELTGGGKRAKQEVVSDDDYELMIDGTAFIDVDKLFHSKKLCDFFNKKYKRVVSSFISDQELKTIIVSKKNVEKGELVQKEKYASKYDCRLAKMNTRIEKFIQDAYGSALPEAPPVINADDLQFFVDKNGTSYDVEMRGTRTKEGIYFKAKDVAAVFENEWYANSILRADSTYQEGVHFVWFGHRGCSAATQRQHVAPTTWDPVLESDRNISDTSVQGHPTDPPHPSVTICQKNCSLRLAG